MPYIFNKDLIQLILPPKLIQYSLTHQKEFREIDSIIKSKAKLMTKKWVYFEEDMSQTVAEIRSKYNIQIL
jgi:hypothetical protein